MCDHFGLLLRRNVVFARLFVARRRDVITFGSGAIGGEPRTEHQGDVLVDRAGMGLLLTNPKLGEHVNDHVRFDL